MSGRALYSGATNRALRAPIEISLGSGTLFRNYQLYEVVTGATGVRGDIYPAAYDDMAFTWDYSGTETRGYSKWNSFSTKATHTNYISARRYATGAYKGETLTQCWVTLINTSSNWRQSAGGGAPTVSLRTQAGPDPGDNNDWVAGSIRAAESNPATARTTKLLPAMVLDDYLWVISYIAGYAPPTASGQECWVEPGAHRFFI